MVHPHFLPVRNPLRHPFKEQCQEAPLLVLLATSASAFAGQFTNLGFDEPDLTHAQVENGFPTGPTAEFLNGWNLSALGPTPMSVRISGATSLSPISLTTAFAIPSTGVDFGKYSLFFGSLGPTPTPVYHLSQTGLVPDNASALRLYVSDAIFGETPPSSFQCLVDGKSLSLEVRPTIRPDILDVDVSAYAGREVKLEFVFGSRFSHAFDIAGFVAVPEPSTYALFGLGAALLFWVSKRSSAK